MTRRIVEVGELADIWEWECDWCTTRQTAELLPEGWGSVLVESKMWSRVGDACSRRCAEAFLVRAWEFCAEGTP